MLHNMQYFTHLRLLPSWMATPHACFRRPKVSMAGKRPLRQSKPFRESSTLRSIIPRAAQASAPVASAPPVPRSPQQGLSAAHMSSLEEIAALIGAKGEEIRKLKADKAPKDQLTPHVAELLRLKEQYKEMNGGVPFDPPKEVKPKKEAAPAPAPAAEDGEVSKKQANKDKKKAAKQAAKTRGGDEAKAEEAPKEAPKASKAAPAPATAAAVPAATTTKKPAAKAPAGSSGAAQASQVLTSSPDAVLVARVVAELVGAPLKLSVNAGHAGEPSMQVGDATLFGDNNIARFVARSKAPVLAGDDALSSALVDQWLEFGLADYEASKLNTLEAHLATKTFLVGSALTLADVAVFVHLHRNNVSPAATHVAVKRWLKLVVDQSNFANALNRVGGGAASAANDEDEMCPPLEGAVDGAVVTRFPPEPSGYLHIGHCKAALVNNYYARRYHGKLVVRFDDTNPSKEKEEFQDSIIRDLHALDVHGDMVTHTSDYFDLCAEKAREMIRAGKAYMDNTPMEQMREERGNRIDSVRRDSPIEENLQLFDSLCKGEVEARAYCLRAKIDMQSENGTLRDPVMYRYNEQPHLRTGTKYKAYPTYDFACPIVDSVEGVTHAMRTTEYNDRDEQYRWFQEAMGLRPVRIHAFARMGYTYTLLSKRKLAWFVENGKVDNWADPRFPTIQGVVRRGIAIPALKKYILSQGASRRVTNLEWDSFWAINKQHYEPIAPRYMAVFKDTSVPLHITNVPAGVVAVSVPLHPKNAEMGERVMRRSNVVFLEGADAETVSVNEKVTLLRWNNVVIKNIEKDNNGRISRMEGELVDDGDFKKTKKFTWLADVPEVVPLQLVEFDHLITKEKIEDGEDFKDYLRPVTRAETEGLGDPCLRMLQAGDVIQLERRGFFRCDRPYLGPNKPCILFMIPDGKTRSMSTLSGALAHR